MKVFKALFVSFILPFFSPYLSAQGLLLNKPDSIYRYEVFLDDPIAIDKINVLNIDFPCVEVLSVNEQELNNGLVLLNSEAGLSERYSRKESGLEMVGYNIRDPFLGLRNKEIIFLSPVGYGAYHKKIDSKGESLFLLSYQVADLPAEVAQLDILDGVQSIQIEGTLNWHCRYIGETRFYNLTRYLDGTFFQNDHTFEISTIKLRKQGWKTLGTSEGRKLRDYFKTSKVSFRNFFTESDALERVRITDYPHQSLLINLPDERLGTKNCNAKRGEVKLYPNPTYGNVNLLFEGGERGNYTFGVYNIIGKKLWETTIDVRSTPLKVQLDMPSLSKGIYLYAITDPSGERIQSRRLIIVEP